jgi:hypothetical protein
MNSFKLISGVAAVIASGFLGLSSARATICDLTTSSVCEVDTIYGTAIFQTDDTQPAGSGFLDNMDNVFLTLRANGMEEGYNTDAQKAPFDAQRDPTRFYDSLQVKDLNLVTYGGADYYQFLIDINEPNSADKSMISLDTIKIYTSSTGGQTTTDVDSLGVKRFDLDLPADSYVLYDDLNSGSGQGDIAFFIPAAAFLQDGFLGLTAANADDYVYLYAKFGSNVGADWTTQGGYEEFWTAKGLTPVPEVGAFAPLASLFLLAAGSRRARKANPRGR